MFRHISIDLIPGKPPCIVYILARHSPSFFCICLLRWWWPGVSAQRPIVSLYIYIVYSLSFRGVESPTLDIYHVLRAPLLHSFSDRSVAATGSAFFLSVFQFFHVFDGLVLLSFLSTLTRMLSFRTFKSWFGSR